MGLQGCQIGKTKVFLRVGHMAELDARRAAKITNSVKVIQRMTRTYFTRRRFSALVNIAVALQTLCRGKLASKQYNDMRMKAVSLKIQTNFRRFSLRSSYVRLRHAVTLIQTCLRAMVARNELRYMRRKRAATLLEAKWRSHREYKRYKRLTKATVITQSGWRGRVARRELRRLKMAARETGALQQAKERLEKQVVELNQRLQQEVRLKTELEERLIAKERESATRAADEASSIVSAENMKALLESEKQRADEYERKYNEILDSNETKQLRLEETKRTAEAAGSLFIKERGPAIEASDEALCFMRESTDFVDETAKIDSLTAEVEYLRDLLESEKERAEEFEKHYYEAREEIEKRSESANTLHAKDRELHMEASSTVKETSVSTEDTGMINALTTEVENLKALLESERQRADQCEKKYNEAVESIGIHHQKLEETERRVLQVFNFKTILLMSSPP